MTAVATAFASAGPLAFIACFVVQGSVRGPVHGGWPGLFWVAVAAAAWTVVVVGRQTVISNRQTRPAGVNAGRFGAAWRLADPLPDPLPAYRERGQAASPAMSGTVLAIVGLGVFVYIGRGGWTNRGVFAGLSTAAWIALLVAARRAEQFRGAAGPAFVAAIAGLAAVPVLVFNAKCTAFAWMAGALAAAALAIGIAVWLQPAVRLRRAIWDGYWLLYVGVIAVATEAGYAALPFVDAIALVLGPLVMLIGPALAARRPQRVALTAAAAAVLAWPLARAVHVAVSYRDAGLL